MNLTFKHLRDITNHLFVAKYIVAHTLDDLEAIEDRVEEEGRQELTTEEIEYVATRLNQYVEELKSHPFHTKAMDSLR